MGAWRLKERLLGRQATLLTGHTVRGAEAVGDRLRLWVDREDVPVVDWTTEHLIADTGYRVDLDRPPFLSDRLRAGSTGSGERQRCRQPPRPRPTARGR